MTLEQVQAAESRLLLPTYERNPILMIGGEGVHLIDEQGTRYLDLLSGIGVNALGYRHPAIEEALLEQAQKLIHTSNLFFHEGQAELALRLTTAAGLDRAFFCNSGTEAWEAALKLSRASAGMRREEGRTIGTKFLALEGSFHGRTMGSVATTAKAKYREPFAPVMPDVEFVRLNDVEDLRAKFSSDVCAVLVEAIQGEGGIRPLSKQFLEAARSLTLETGALLVIDEIQAGLGRTGKWFAYQHYDVMPDITTLAKPLAGGLPLGAMLCTEAVSKAIHPGMHGTTFGGGPLACAVAIAVFDAIENDGLLENVEAVGGHFREGLEALRAKHSIVTDVRGMGLMLAIELETAELAKAALAEMTARHILINRTSETVLRFLPPYLLGIDDVGHALRALDEVLAGIGPAQLATAAHTGGRIGD
jgi:acetylornithine aminotransferase/acetylornithine/N-succinyldiaminopimelate aminotransferase